MALVQTVMWTAVPNGIDAATGKLKVRCLVSPRLSSSPEANQTLGVLRRLATVDVQGGRIRVHPVDPGRRGDAREPGTGQGGV